VVRTATVLCYASYVWYGNMTSLAASLSIMHRPQAPADINTALCNDTTELTKDWLFTCITIINVPKTHAHATLLQHTIHTLSLSHTHVHSHSHSGLAVMYRYVCFHLILLAPVKHMLYNTMTPL